MRATRPRDPLMDAVYFLIPMSLVLLVGAVGMFIWSLRKGQFEDLDSPAHRVIIDDREERARLDHNDADGADDKP